jgi:glycosyltransferase involved in cell wall biosynthesis
MVRKLAARLNRKQPFDIVHQTTFHTFRIPFSCSKLGIPTVWGPIAGGESVPAGFEGCLGPAGAGEGRRAVLNRLNLAMPWVGGSLQRTSRILVSNRTTLEFLSQRHHGKCVVMSPNALREEDLSAPMRAESKREVFEILFAGNCAPTRAMPLVFEALAKGLPVKWRLRVVGGGSALDYWKSEVERLNLGGNVEFTGPVPRETLQEFYNQTSALVFPGLRDSGGSALLEAMTLALPILTFDWGGPGEMVDSTSAVMIEARTPAQAIEDIHAGLRRLATHPGQARQLGANARQRALNTFRWERKWKVVNQIYENLAR